MAYNTTHAGRIREYLSRFPNLKVEEKKMFGGLSFIINGKMCINVSGENLMCRFDPELTEALAERKGFLPVIMKRKKYEGYCYVEPIGFKGEIDFEFWMNVCINFNDRAKASRK